MAHAKALILILVAAGFLSGCEEPIPKGVQKAGEDARSLVFEGFKARGSFQGVKQWEAEATRARVFQGSQKASADDVGITYFQGGKAVSHATARHADIDLKNYD